MGSIYERLHLRYEPIGVKLTDEKPAGAMEFAEGRWGCVAALLTAAMRGKRAVFSEATCVCMGGRVGLGFRDGYPAGFEYFLSRGDEHGECPLMKKKPEGYKKSPELVLGFIKSLPPVGHGKKYVVFRPLHEFAEEKPEIVVLYAAPDQLSALIVLANYDSAGRDAVSIPFGAGCQTAVRLALAEAKQGGSHAFVGMTDISARPLIEKDLLSFSVSYARFCEMEENIETSFLDREAWKKVERRL